MTAEILKGKVTMQIEVHASMRPRSNDRGNTHRRGRTDPDTDSFNEAAI